MPPKPHAGAPLLHGPEPMGLSSLEFNFLSLARRDGLLPSGGAILEFGACETIDLNVAAALEYMLPAGAERDLFIQQALALKAADGPSRRFEEARLLYRALFQYDSYTAVELSPESDHCIQQDLNLPFDLGRRFDICINNGTSEHVFNQANFYQAMHDHTRAGGVMIHWVPTFGYHDHGFYTIQPGLFHDLARDNDYEFMLGKLVTEKRLYDLLPYAINKTVIEANPDLREALGCVILRKRADAPFRYPLQRPYAPLRRFRGTTVG